MIVEPLSEAGRRVMRLSGIATWAVIAFFLAFEAFAHSGGLDAFGGHISNDGSYHFHSGPLSGESFVSETSAKTALNAQGGNSPFSTVKIGSFNIRVFSTRSRSDSELIQIANRIQPFDIVAIQELRDETALKRLQALIQGLTGTEWRYEMSAPVGRGVKERYAFLYRTDRVLLKNHGKLVDDPKDKFIREPYYATFRAGYFDFTLLTIHALYKSKNAPERKVEFDTLASVFQALRDGDKLERDLILLGDFNDDSANPRFEAIRSIQGMQCLFQQPTRTTIGDVSLYDNICFQAPFVREYAAQTGLDKFDMTVYGNDRKKASREVSDHRPVWAAFRMESDDD